MAVYGIFITWWLYPRGDAWSPWNLSNLGAQTSHFLSFPQDIFGKQIRKNCHTVFPRIISGGDYFFFRIKRGKGGDYSRKGDYFSYCSLDAVPKIYIYIFFIPLNQAIITSNKLNMGFCSKLGSWINFQSLNNHSSVLLDQIPLQLYKEGIKEREDDERGGGAIIIRGRRLF